MLISAIFSSCFLAIFAGVLFLFPISLCQKLQTAASTVRLQISVPMMSVAKFSLVILIASQLSIVILRYIFGVSFGWLTDLGTFSFAAIPFFAIATTLTSNEHVRLDIIYGILSERNKDIVNLIGVTLFLTPVCCFITIAFWPSLVRSWVNLEAFTTVGGLPAKYLFKSLIPIMTLSLVVHGFESGLNSAFSLRQGGIKND